MPYKAKKENIYNFIIDDLSISRESVENTVELILNGATVPFIARYRKEKTGGLDEVKIRDIKDRLHYFADLEKYKETVVDTIESLGKMNDELYAKIDECRNKEELDDLYLPYKPKKRTKAVVAREQGLGPLAYLILEQGALPAAKDELLKSYIDPDKDLHTTAHVIEGVIEIITEVISEDAESRGMLREYFEKNANIVTRPTPEWQGKKSKYEMYYSFKEPLKDSPSHRLLAIRRGANENVITWSLEVDRDYLIQRIGSRFIIDPVFPLADILRSSVRKAYIRMAVSIEHEFFSKRIEEAELEAINVFAKNLRSLLLDPPVGCKVIMGIDPGQRTGCKVAVVDANGKFIEYANIFPNPPENRKREAAETVAAMISRHAVELVAIGNGTASRETMDFVKEVMKSRDIQNVKVLEVSEAGASVYSASDVARDEFPELDVTVRGAISIARRLQDPLSELVKIDPKSIGVGQYQHDVNQVQLKKSLDEVVESCVNFVGVELNTASKELLSYVSGVGPFIASKIVEHRKLKGPFSSRTDIMHIPVLGDKVFENAAGFLRIRDSKNPLDNSAIHPESYRIVETMASDLSVSIDKLLGNDEMISGIRLNDYVSIGIGIPTLEDIARELRKPGLDPRNEFVNIEYRPGIYTIKDLKRDMRLFGKVTNVTNFGAFVDIGVHQDGLIHISNLSRKFIKDPHEVIAVGDKVKVRVISVDLELKRIDLEKL